MYLKYRDSIVLNHNPFILTTDDPNTTDQVCIVVLLSLCLLEVIKQGFPQIGYGMTCLRSISVGMVNAVITIYTSLFILFSSSAYSCNKTDSCFSTFQEELRCWKFGT